MIYIITGTVWVIIGVASYVYWWTKKFDFTTKDLLVCFVLSFLGPINFLIGWSIYLDDKKNPTIIVKKKK